MPSDFPSDRVDDAIFTAATGSAWTTPSNILTDDGSAVATYSGTTQDKLYILGQTKNIQTGSIIAMILLTKGNATGTGDNAVLQMCLTNNGTTCLSDVQELTLSATANTTVCFPNANCTDPTSINTWRNPPLTKEELSGGPLGSLSISDWGVLLWKKGTGAGTVNLQFAGFDWMVDYTPGAFDNGAQWSCGSSTVNDSSANPGYLCMFKNQGIASSVYWVPTNTALTSRFLGYMRMTGEATMQNTYIASNTATWSDTDPRKYYFLASDTSNNPVLVEATMPASGNSYYNADAASGSTWTATYTNLTVAPNHVVKLIQDVDPTFTSAFSCGESTMQRGRVVIRCRRGFQDSYGYIAVYKLSTAVMERVARTWDHALTRWCGYHTEEPANASSRQYSYTVSELNKGGVAAGPFQVTLNGAVNDSQTNFTVTSTHSTPGEPVEASAPTELMAKAVDDLIQIDSEVVRITAITSATQFTVERGYGPSNPAAHSNSAPGTMLCGGVNWAVDGSQGPAMFWNIEDGTLIKDNSGIAGAHMSPVFPGDGAVAGYRISANGWVASTHTSDSDPTETLYGITDSPAFAGVAPSISGNDHQKHPSSAQQINATTGQRNWGNDILSQVNHAGFNLNSPTHIGGSLWKFTKNAADYNPKKLPAHASVGVKVMEDISTTTTGNVIGTTSSDNYKFCVARAVNECRTGSAVGDIYANAPTFGVWSITGATNATPIVVTTSSPHGYFQRGTVTIAGVGGNTAANGTRKVTPLTPYTFSLQDTSDVDIAGNGTYTSGGTVVRTPACFAGGESITLAYPHQEDEMCFGDTPPYSQQAVQLRLDRVDTTGRNSRQLGHVFTPPHRQAATASAKVTPDGAWMILAPNFSFNYARTTENLLLKLPPFPADDVVDRTSFIQNAVSLTGPAGAATAILEFGYTSSFYCTSRNEVCVANNSTGTSANPFYWASESYSRVSCPAGVCSINIPIIPDRIAYARAKYYDGGGSLIETGTPFIVTESSSPAGGSGGGEAAPSIIRIRGKGQLRGKVNP